MTQPTFDRPFPALTPAQRYSLDLHGYVVIPSVLTRDEAEAIREALQRTKCDLVARNATEQGNGPFLLRNQPHHVYMGGIVEIPEITAYVTHPRIVGMAEELMASEARIVEVNAHINSRPKDEPIDPSPKFGFHRGTDIPFGSHIVNGLYHCSFVKALTNLTDLGPDDGGTVVIAGSHRIDAPTADIVAAAYEDRSLIHQVIAPAGSTLLFNETLIHATGQIRSDNERAIVICGYGPTLFPFWDGSPLSDSFVASIPPQLKNLFLGKAHWTRGSRYRTLKDPVDARPFSLGHWQDRAIKPADAATTTGG